MDHEKYLRFDLQFITSLILLVFAGYTSGFRAFQISYFIFYALSLPQLLLLILANVYARMDSPMYTFGKITNMFNTNNILMVPTFSAFVFAFSQPLFVYLSTSIIHHLSIPYFNSYTLWYWIFPFVSTIIFAYLMSKTVMALNFLGNIDFKVRPDKLKVYKGEEAEIDILVQNNSRKNFKAVTLEVSSEAQVKIDLGSGSKTENNNIHIMEFSVPPNGNTYLMTKLTHYLNEEMDSTVDVILTLERSKLKKVVKIVLLA